MDSKDWLCSLRSRSSGSEIQFFGMPSFSNLPQILTRPAGSLNGSGRRRTPLTTLKIALVAPMRLDATLEEGS
jgi:hypothetical protein